jgi:endoribonuclease Dicer
MAMAFPAIIHRIDSVLIVLDACNLLRLEIPPELALEAMTKDSDNSGDHDTEQINFQTGMGDNYERLEFLGDCFLKMATTISIYTLMPDGNECKYHVERMLLICNQNLFNHAVDRKLQEFVRSKAFDRRTWYPDLPLKKGKAPKTSMKHNLADKTVADVCEALIGAAYLTSKDSNMDLAVKAVTRMTKSKNHRMKAFKDYYKVYKVPEWQEGNASASQRSLVQKVAQATGYRFRSAQLVQSAFKHPSWPYESVPDYQRLEFLGDSLLDMAIVDYLYRNFPRADPQWLTEHKMAMVSNQFLGCLCVKLGLHPCLLSSTSSLLSQIRDYVVELEVAEENARKEAEEEGTPMRKDFWLKVDSPPKAYADVIEALVGAMFVDSKYKFSVVETFFTKFIQPYFQDMRLYDTFANKHPVTFLSKKMHQELSCTNWRISAEAVPCGADQGMAALKDTEMCAVFMVHQKVIADDTSESGRYSKQRAASKALKILDSFGEDVEAAKRFLGCDCQLGGGDVEVDHGTAV